MTGRTPLRVHYRFDVARVGDSDCDGILDAIEPSIQRIAQGDAATAAVLGHSLARLFGAAERVGTSSCDFSKTANRRSVDRTLVRAVGPRSRPERRRLDPRASRYADRRVSPPRVARAWDEVLRTGSLDTACLSLLRRHKGRGAIRLSRRRQAATARKSFLLRTVHATR